MRRAVFSLGLATEKIMSIKMSERDHRGGRVALLQDRSISNNKSLTPPDIEFDRYFRELQELAKAVTKNEYE